MKNKTLILLKAQFAARYSLRGREDGGAGSKRIGRIVLGLLIVLLAAVYVGLYCLAVDSLVCAAVDMEYPDIAFDLVIAAIMAICFVFGIPVVLSNLFLVRDGELLSSLPVTAGQIFTSKFLLVYLGETAVAALFTLPAAIIYAVRVPEVASAWYFLRTLYVTLLLPALPLLLSSIVVLPLLLVASRARRRELFITVGSCILVGAMVLLQFRLQSVMDVSAAEGELFATLLKNNFSRITSLAVPPMSWASNGIYAGGLTSTLSLFCFTVAVVICFFAARGLMSLIYRASLRSTLENRRAARRFSAGQAVSEPTGSISAVIRREWIALLRSPTWVMNGLCGGLIALIFMVVPLVQNEQRLAFAALVSELDGWILALVLGGVIALLSGMNLGAGSIMSRQGHGLRIVKSLPIPYEKLCLAYMIFGSELALVWTVPLLVGSVAVLGFPLLPALGGTLLGLVVSTGMTAPMEVCDMLRPKLDWTNEAEPIKQNIGGLIGMLLSFALLAVIALLCWLLMKAGLSPAVGYAAAMAMGLISVAALWPPVIKKAAKRLEAIDC